MGGDGSSEAASSNGKGKPGLSKGEMMAAFKGKMAAKGKQPGAKAGGAKGKEVSSGKGDVSTTETTLGEVNSGKGPPTSDAAKTHGAKTAEPSETRFKSC